MYHSFNLRSAQPFPNYLTLCDLGERWNCLSLALDLILPKPTLCGANWQYAVQGPSLLRIPVTVDSLRSTIQNRRKGCSQSGFRLNLLRDCRKISANEKGNCFSEASLVRRVSHLAHAMRQSLLIFECDAEEIAISPN